jgi:hypothetical protein
MLKAFPFTIFPLLAYNALVFLIPDRLPDWSAEQFSVGLFSAETLTLTAGDVLVFIGLLFLMFEMLRAASVSRGAIASHLASVIVFLVYVAELLVIPEAATAAFAVLTAIALVDVLAGIYISARVTMRDVNISEL